MRITANSDGLTFRGECIKLDVIMRVADVQKNGNGRLSTVVSEE